MKRKLIEPCAAIALLALAACAAPPPATVEPPAPPPEPAAPVSSMQLQMDRFNVPFRVPEKGKAILVNIPSYEMIAIEDGEEVFRSDAIVGAPGGPETRTPVLDTHVSVIRFRPSWRPTPTMIRSGAYEDRTWPPGKNNPLGLAAIRLEPGMLIYLHDTNRKKLFERDMRALSYGCVRVQRWDETIAWLLDVDLDEVHRNANGKRTFDMPADPIPVMFRYYRSFPDEAGELKTYDDVYRMGPATAPAQSLPAVSLPAGTAPPPPA